MLGHSLDELPPGTRRLLGLIEAHVEARAGEAATPRERVRFTRRELREALGWGDTQLKVHLARLVSLELIWAHRGPRGSHLYELALEGGGEAPRLPGLIDPEALPIYDYDAERSGQSFEWPGSGCPPVGARSGSGRPSLEGSD